MIEKKLGYYFNNRIWPYPFFKCLNFNFIETNMSPTLQQFLKPVFNWGSVNNDCENIHLLSHHFPMTTGK